ncbi:MAG: methyltransferase domain-containing protein [candidate division Zixibacteria bacterium]|nr:methyltransferase domain-containing protein [candidate division Zixibacteria bacterium]
MFDKLEQINERPSPFQYYTNEELWTNDYTSSKMLEYHLNESIDVASRNRNFINRSVDWIVAHFGVNKDTAIVDFGCGPGLYTIALAERGARVTGIDFSENSIKYARNAASRRDLNIDYVMRNYLEFQTDKTFDLILMIMCDFCALSPDQRATLLSKFRSLMKPGSALLLDVYSLKAFDKKEESATYEFNQLNGFWSDEDYYCFVNIFKYDKEKVVLDKYTIFEPSRERLIFNWLQYYDVDTLDREFKQKGLSIKETFLNVAGDPFSPESEEFAVVAMRS